MLDRLGEEGGKATVFVPAERLLELYQSKGEGIAELTQAMPAAAAQVSEAVASGGDVAVPISDYLLKLVPKFGTDLAKDVRLDPGGLTVREAEKAESVLSDTVRSEIAHAARVGDQQSAIDIAADSYADNVAGQLIEAGEVPAHARQIATLYRERFVARVTRSGLDPEQLLADEGLRVVAEEPGTPPATSTPDNQVTLSQRPLPNPDATMIAAAEEHFGVTTDPREAGFVLPDGRMLDLSERRTGGDTGSRARDHSETFGIESVRSAVLAKGNDSFGQPLGHPVVEFQNSTGAIRVDIAAGLVDSQTGITSAQAKAIADAARALGVTLNVEAHDANGDEIAHAVMHRPTAAALRRFYDSPETAPREFFQIPDAARESLSAATERFREQIDSVLHRGPNLDRRGHLVDVADTPLVYSLLGVKRLPLRMTPAAVRKILLGEEHDHGKHGDSMSREVFDRLPELLADPLMIFDSKTMSDSWLAVLDARDRDGDTIVAAIHKDTGRVGFNKLASVYGKDNPRWFAHEAREGRLRYVNNEKARRWSGLAGVYFPRGGPATGRTQSTPGGAGRQARIFTEADLSSLRSANPAEFYSPGEPGSPARGSITLDPTLKSTLIRLGGSRDLSTFLHESGHLFLGQLAKDAARENAPAGVRSDLKIVLDYLGAASSEAITREQNEQFARGFEAYLREGKAPSLALRDVFARFRSWLVSVYRSMRGLDVELNDDIRGVMDRLLATDAQIEAAKGAARTEALFEGPGDASGMNPAEFDAYRQARDRLVEGPHTRLLREVLRRMDREKRAEWKARRAEVRAQVAKDVAARPIYRAREFLRTGRLLKPDGSEVKKLARVRLDRGALVERYGEPVLEALGGNTTRRVWGVRDAVHPDQVAELFGYPTGDALVRDLVESPETAVVIEQETDSRMQAEHGDLLEAAAVDPSAVPEDGEARFDLLLIEERALARRAGAQATPRQVALAAAQRIIAGKQVGDLRPDLHRAAAVRERRAAMEAFRAGNVTEAAGHKRRELIATLLERESSKALTERDKKLDYLRKLITQQVRERIGRAGADYLEQIDGLLERFDLRKSISGRKAQRRASFASWLAERERDGETVIVPDDLRNEALRQPWRTMTLEELRGLHDSAKVSIHAVLRRERRHPHGNKLLSKKKSTSFREHIDLHAQAVLRDEQLSS